MTLRVSTPGVSTWYRQLHRPASAGWTGRRWLRWLAEQGVTPSVTPYEEGVCERCRRPTTTRPDGTHWPRCYLCNVEYRDVLDGVVPVCYSVTEGLESAVWRVKNDPSHSWLRVPLAVLLHAFLERHYSCVERRYGSVDVVTSIPSHAAARGGRDHLKELLASVSNWRQPWDMGLLEKGAADRAERHRQQVTPGLFQVSPGRDVTSRRVLLVDDTYTSGGTVASAAHALREAGAAKAVAVTLGRQLSRDHVESHGLIESLPGRGLDLSLCALYPPR